MNAPEVFCSRKTVNVSYSVSAPFAPIATGKKKVKNIGKMQKSACIISKYIIE